MIGGPTKSQPSGTTTGLVQGCLASRPFRLSDLLIEGNNRRINRRHYRPDNCPINQQASALLIIINTVYLAELGPALASRLAAVQAAVVTVPPIPRTAHPAASAASPAACHRTPLPVRAVRLGKSAVITAVTVLSAFYLNLSKVSFLNVENLKFQSSSRSVRGSLIDGPRVPRHSLRPLRATTPEPTHTLDSSTPNETPNI